MPATAAIGVDLGSLNTRCAFLEPSRRMPVIIRNALSNESTPTIVHFPPAGTGDRQFGEAVAAKDITSPANTIVDLRQWLLEGSAAAPRPLPGIVAGSEDDTPVAASHAAGFALRQILRLVPAFAATTAEAGAGVELDVAVAVPGSCADRAGVEASLAEAVAGCCRGDAGAPVNLLLVDEATALAAYFHHLRHDALPDGDDLGAAPVTVIANIGDRSMLLVAVRACKGAVGVVASAAAAVGSRSVDEAITDAVFDSVKAAQKKDIKGHAKSYKKVLREAKKAKEITSAVEQGVVQLEGLAEDVDVRVTVTRAEATAASAAMLEALGAAADALKGQLAEGAEVEVECVGGAWRAPCVQALLREKFGVAALGVKLDSNMCIAEGCAIVATARRAAAAAAASAASDDAAPAADDTAFDPVHAAAASVAVAATIAPVPEAPVAWADLEATLRAQDAAHAAHMKAVDRAESLILQTLTLAERCPGLPPASLAALQGLLREFDDLAGDPATTAAALDALHDRAAAQIDSIPEIAALKAREAAEQAARDAEMERMAKEKEADKELKSDPQRLRVAQQRREQGAELFKQEHWEEANTRFVQALSILGQLYDTTSPENKSKKDEISLSCHLNIASCCVRLQRWRIAISNATNALDLKPDHPKALFRRGQAHNGQGNLEEAVADLQRALALSSGDAAVKAELESAQRKIEQSKAKEKRMFSKMFA